MFEFLQFLKRIKLSLLSQNFRENMIHWFTVINVKSKSLTILFTNIKDLTTKYKYLQMPNVLTSAKYLVKNISIFLTKV